MKITTKSDYGLIMMIELAKQKDNKNVSLSSIANKYHLSLSYIEQLATSLRRSKIIKSRQGVKGGYILARDAKKINIAEIIKAVGDDILPVACNHPERNCTKSPYCNAKKSWAILSNVVFQSFRNTSLNQLANE